MRCSPCAHHTFLYHRKVDTGTDNSSMSAKQNTSGGKSSQSSKKKKSSSKPKTKTGPQRVVEVSAPAAKSYRIRNNGPIERSRGHQERMVVQREMVLSNIVSSTGFALMATISIQPGLVSSFPWLSKEAQNWQQYNVEELVVEYIPTTGTNTLGEIIISPEYDVSNAAPDSEINAMQNLGAVADSCWTRIVCPLDRKAMHGLGPRKFIRTGNVSGDLKTFDAAKVHIFTNNFASGGVVCGKLYFRYKISLMVPQNAPNTFGSPRNVFFSRLQTDLAMPSSSLIPIFQQVIANGLGATVATPYTQLILPSGNYRFDWTFNWDFDGTPSVSAFNDVIFSISANGLEVGFSSAYSYVVSPGGGTDLRVCVSGFCVISMDALNATQGPSTTILVTVNASNTSSNLTADTLIQSACGFMATLL